MASVIEKQINTSNKDVDWSRHYDFYEIELRDMYKTVSKPQNESHYVILKKIASKHLKKDKVFCELGFGAGLTLRYALKQFGMVYGLDISPKNIELTAKELQEEGFENFKLFTSDLMNFDERFTQKFDVISFIHGLEHFGNDDYRVILKNIGKYLKTGGIFSGALPFKSNFNYRMCPECHRIFEIDGHVSSHDLDSLKKVFTENGWKILYLGNFNFKYAIKDQSFIKKIYSFIFYFLLKKRSNSQIEFVVTPFN